MPAADNFVEPLDIVEPDVRRGFSGMFTRMKRRAADRAESISHATVKPLTNGSITKIVATAGGDNYFLYTQGAAATVWTVTHNFGRYPNVMIMDNSGIEMDALVTHTSLNALTITFNTAQDGQAALS